MEALCRICYSGPSENGPLRNPCHCRGSIGAIHERCLFHWIEVQGDGQAVPNPRCELCHTHYLFLYDEPWEDTQYANLLCDSLWSNIGFHFFIQYALVVVMVPFNIYIYTYYNLVSLQIAYHALYLGCFGILFALKLQSSKQRYARAFFNTERSIFLTAYCALWGLAGFRCNGQAAQILALITVQTFLSLFPYFHHQTLCTLNTRRARRLLEYPR